MSLVSINWNPGDRQLRQFGIAALIALPTLAWIWSRGNVVLVGILAACGAVIATIGWLSPRTIRPLFLGVTLIMLPVGIVMSEVVLAIVFFAVFLPVGFVFRLLGRDAMTRRWDRDAKSYWSEKSMHTERQSYFRQW